MRHARYGGAESDESQNDATQQHWDDNTSVENSVSNASKWWQNDIVIVSRRRLKQCVATIEAMQNPTPIKRAMAWLPFAEWIALCKSTTEVGTTVNFMGELLDDFPHAYGVNQATKDRFTHLMPSITQGINIPKGIVLFS